jgi:glycosyltransferase involved in cell wall biosynthesis
VNTILAVAPNFPSPSTSADGQSNYLTRVVQECGLEQNTHVEIVSLRIGNQQDQESGPGWRVQRVSPQTELADIFSLYLPAHLTREIDTLTKAAVLRAESLGTNVPVWCHGYETGPTIRALSQRGHHIVAVPHYLVGVETIHDLALGDDQIRRKAFDSPWATTLGRLTPTPVRPMAVRWASRVGPWAKLGPWPQPIRTQFAKLSMDRAYPCTVGKSGHVFAGAPETIPDPKWPWPINDHVLRIAMVGRPTGQKGWDYAVEALSTLRDADAKRIELVLIGGLGHGNGPYSSYSKIVADKFEHLHPHKVANLGARSHPETLAHLHAADLLLFPSIFEPFGLVLLEAMKAKCAVLASDAAGPSDIVQAPWGLTVPFGVPEHRAEGLVKGLESFLAMERDGLSKLQGLAKEASRSFTWSHCAQVHRSALFPR